MKCPVGADLYCVPGILSDNEEEEEGNMGRGREGEMLMTSHCDSDGQRQQWTSQIWEGLGFSPADFTLEIRKCRNVNEKVSE